MACQADGITWVADLRPYYSSGQTIQYYIETQRSDLTAPAHANKKVYRPLMYKMDYVNNLWTGVPPTEYLVGTIYH